MTIVIAFVCLFPLLYNCYNFFHLVVTFHDTHNDHLGRPCYPRTQKNLFLLFLILITIAIYLNHCRKVITIIVITIVNSELCDITENESENENENENENNNARAWKARKWNAKAINVLLLRNDIISVTTN